LSLLVPLLVAFSAQAEGFELPPDPRDRPPALVVEPRFELVVPVATNRLCPAGAQCLYGAGVGIGVLVERRFRSGVGVGIAYDLRFLGGDNVYELTTLQSLSVSLRYFFMLTRSAHPFVGVEVGGALFGDTFGVDTMGMHLGARAGVEIEATAALSFTMYAALRTLYTRPFTSQPDGVARSRSGGMDLSVDFGAGVALRFGE
jgi:hypothetical protein